jgi:uncharacterized protein DUF3800
MIIVYLDESGHHTGDVLTVAALVAPEQDWTRLEKAWRRVLRMAGVSAFRMSQYENRIGEFEGWSDQKRFSVIIDLAAALKSTITYGVAASLVVADFQAVIVPVMTDMDDSRREPYIFLLQSCMEDIAKQVQTPLREKIAFVFERNDFTRASILDQYSYLLRVKRWGHIYGPITFADKGDAVPLQCADMLAYEARKDVLNRFLTDPPRPVRKLLESLRESGHLDLGFYNREALMRTLEQIKALDPKDEAAGSKGDLV